MRERARTRGTHQRSRGDQVGEVETRRARFLGFLNHGRRADRKIGLELSHGSEILLERRTKLHVHAFRLQPLAIRVGPTSAGAGRTHVAQVRTALDQQARDQQLGTFVAGQRDTSANRRRRKRCADRRQHTILRRIDARARHVAGQSDRLEPICRAIVADRRRADNAASGRIELAVHARIERMDRGDRGAIERGVQFSPLAGRHQLPGGKPHGLEHHADAHGVRGENLAHQRDGGLARARYTRRLHGTCLSLGARVFQHRAGEHVLRLGMRRNAKARHVDADDSHAVDFFWQQLQRHAGRGRHTKIGDDDRIVVGRIGNRVHRVADILEQLARDQRLGVERHVADRSPRAVEMRGEGQAVHAAGGTREDRRRAAHAQTDPQRTERGAHALRLIVRAGGIIARVLLERRALASDRGSGTHLLLAAMTPAALARHGRRRAIVDDLRGTRFVGEIVHGSDRVVYDF